MFYKVAIILQASFIILIFNNIDQSGNFDLLFYGYAYVVFDSLFWKVDWLKSLNIQLLLRDHKDCLQSTTLNSCGYFARL